MAVSGDTAIVGARQGAAVADTGAAYIFQRNQGGLGNWGEVTKLTASDAQAGDQFGLSVAISAGTATVGANLEDAGGGNNAGAAYVFGPPPPVGGLVVDLDEGPLPAAQPSGGNAGRLANTLAGVAALAVALALGGAAWYARRRWVV